MKQVKTHKIDSSVATGRLPVRVSGLWSAISGSLTRLAVGAGWLAGLSLLLSAMSSHASVLNTATVTADNAPDNSVTICTTQVPGAVAVLNSATVAADNIVPVSAGNVCVDIFNTFDFGDAPSSYSTSIAEGGPRHVIIPDLFIGAGINNEADGIPDANAGSDTDSDADSGNLSDPDVQFSTPSSASGSEISARVRVTNNTGGDAFICAWLDRWTDVGSIATLDNVFDTSADAADAGVCQTVSNGGGTFNFTWENLPANVSPPANPAEPGTYARFRLCQVEANCNTPASMAPSGEVEDYFVPFNFEPTEATIGEVNLSAVSVDELLAGLTRDQLLDLLASWDEELAQLLAGADISEILESLRGFLDPDGDGQVALFQWETLAQYNTLGFYVERQGEADDSWQRISEDMLPAMIAPLGAQYLILDPEAVSGNTYQYRMIERETTGGTKTYGPFILDMP